MKVKTKLGMGLKGKKKKSKCSAAKKGRNKNKVAMSRILPVPTKVGGAVPFLIPLFAGLSATGALAGGAAGIVKSVNAAKAAKEQLDESRRHNKKMEAIALGKGMYLRPHKAGKGLKKKKQAAEGKKKDRGSKFARSTTY